MWLHGLSETAQIAIGLLVILIFGLGLLARKHPHISWLQGFKLSQLPEPQRARLERSQKSMAGAQFILLGIVVPLGYAALTLMMMNSFDPVVTLMVAAFSLLCIGIGVYAIVTAVRRRG